MHELKPPSVGRAHTCTRGDGIGKEGEREYGRSEDAPIFVSRQQDPHRGRQQPGEVRARSSRGWRPRQCPTPSSRIDLSQRKLRYRPERISWMDKLELYCPSFSPSLVLCVSFRPAFVVPRDSATTNAGSTSSGMPDRPFERCSKLERFCSMVSGLVNRAKRVGG